MDPIFDVVAIDHLTLLARTVVAFAAVVVVPLGTRLLESGREPRVPRGALFGAAACLSAALVVRAPLGGALVLPWAMVTSWLAAQAVLARLRALRATGLLDVTETAALVYLPVGAVWAAAYRLGIPLAGFAGLECLLTAAHFHFAGFGACALVTLVGRELGAEAGPIYRVGAAGTIVSVALVALGITASHAIERVAAWALVASVLLVDVCLVRLALRSRGLARGLLLAAPLASVVAALFAAHFAESGFATLDDAKLRRMLYLHGIVNAFGFVGLGLFGIARRQGARSGTSVA
jgi:hypothetical protein